MKLPISMKRATASEVYRGIYIDFEGREKESPSLIGILIDGRFEQVVLDRSLGPAAEAKGLAMSTIEEEIKQLLQTAKSENRWVFAFTQHELNTVRKYTSLGDDLERQYKDGHKIVKTWFRGEYPNILVKGMGLKDYSVALGEPPPKHFGSRKAAGRIKYLRDSLARNADYDSLPAGAKRKWTVLLSYNRWDCDALKRLVTFAVNRD